MNQRAAILAAGMLIACRLAHAGPADYVFTPAVEYGEKEIDFKYGAARPDGGAPRESAWSLGLGYGAKEWWFTEFYLKYARSSPDGTKFDAWEWENKFQLTETGQYPVDVGLVVELERPKDRAEGWEMVFGPLFQTEFGKLQLNGNVLFERHFRAAVPGETELLYQWQAKYRWRPALEFGLQGFGAMGKWDRWDPREDRIHQAGPAVFGKLALGGRQAVKYNAAYLLGTSKAAPDRTFRMQVELEF